MADAAGIVYQTKDGDILLGKRGAGGDHPGEWAFPGGKIDAGESAQDAAAREFAEETGWTVADITHVSDANGFSAFRASGEKFEPAGDGENAEFGWFKPWALPDGMHPAAAAILASQVFFTAATEYDVAQAMAAGILPSPQKYANVWLFVLRITGTGLAFRDSTEQFVWRDPKEYLTPEFLARCNGLPVIWDHPSNGMLTDKDFSDRIIGTVALPFISGDEVYGVAKIYNEGAAAEMLAGELSTSPTLITKNDNVLTLKEGLGILIEGRPRVLDHLAICHSGVWDKGEGPTGVVLTNDGGSAMTDQVPAGEPTLKEVMGALTAIAGRLEKLEQTKVDAGPAVAGDPTLADTAMTLAADANAGLEKAKEELEGVKADAAKRDAALVARIAELEGKIPAGLSAEDQDAIAAAQIKADSVYAALGKTAPRPMIGERPDAYRARLVAGIQEHSAKWKAVDVAKADSAFLAIIEADVFADATAHAAKPDAMGAGNLIPFRRTGPAGHTIVEYKGDNAGYLASIQPPVGQKLVGIRKQGV